VKTDLTQDHVPSGGLEKYAMTIIERISTLVRANIIDLIDQAEDPETVVKQLLLDMHSQAIQARTQVAAAIADQNLLFQRYQDNQSLAANWQRRAELAVNSADDDLARQALMRRAAFEQTADGFKQQYDEQSIQVTTLKEALAQLEARIAEAETAKNLVITRARRASAETALRTPLVVLDDCGPLHDFERMKHKVEELEARADALGEVAPGFVDQRFAQLKTGPQVERDLANLKAKKALAEPVSKAR
jgi:phage shock protein A